MRAAIGKSLNLSAGRRSLSQNRNQLKEGISNKIFGDSINQRESSFGGKNSRGASAHSWGKRGSRPAEESTNRSPFRGDLRNQNIRTSYTRDQFNSSRSPMRTSGHVPAT
jgi:hypothetical protein